MVKYEKGISRRVWAPIDCKEIKTFINSLFDTSDVGDQVPQDLLDLAYAAEARVWHGVRASQYLVDVMQSCVRDGDIVTGTTAERAIRIIDRGPSARAR